MLLIKTKIGPSQIHGLGLFADQFIPKDTLVWAHNDLVDRVYRYEQLSNIPEPAQSIIRMYGWLEGQYFILPGDNARFTNHSSTPNCTTSPGISIANRDIEINEEITEDYASFVEEMINEK